VKEIAFFFVGVFLKGIKGRRKQNQRG